MTTLLTKDYQYSSVLWEKIMQRAQEIIRDEYNISPYISPSFNISNPSSFRIWSSAQGTETMFPGAWHKEYTISVNYYLKTEDSERFYQKLYQESERLYQLFFNNQGTNSNQILGFFGGEPQGIQITRENDYFRIEVLFTCKVFRADSMVYTTSSPSSLRAVQRALLLKHNFWSLGFDGSNDYIDVGSDSTIDNIFDGGGSLSMWFNSSTIDTSHGLIQKKGSGNGWLMRLQDNSGGTAVLYFLQEFDGGTNYSITSPTRYFTTNKWYHIVVTYNNSSTSNSAIVYVNGEVFTMTATTTGSGTRRDDSSQALNIGKDNLYEFSGAMSEVSLFNTELSASAISSMYNDGSPILLKENQGSYKSSGNLLAYYRMGSGEGDKTVTKEGLVIADQVDTSLTDDRFGKGTPIDDNSDWTAGSGWVADADNQRLVATSTTGTIWTSLESGVGTGDIVLITYTISNREGGYVRFIINGATNGTGRNANGTYSEYVRVKSTAYNRLHFDGTTPAFTGHISDISVKKINGLPGEMLNFDGLDFTTNVPQIYDNALFSNSLVFDGADDYMQTNNAFNNTNHSISVWVNITADTDSKTIFDNRDSDNDGIRIMSFTDEKIYYQLNTSDVVSSSAHSGSWVHVVATYDGSTQKLYINGSLDSSASTSQSISVSANATIGTTSYGTKTDYYNGNISDMAIYNTGLDATNVTAMYNSGNPIDLTCDAGNYNNANNLVAYWKMGDGYLDVLPSASAGTIMDQVTPIEDEGNFATTVNMDADNQSTSVPE